MRLTEIPYYQGFLGDWVSFACCHLKSTTSSSLSIETAFQPRVFLAAVGIASDWRNAFSPIHLFLWYLFLCEVITWWGQMAKLSLKNYLFTSAICLSPCPGDMWKRSSGFKSLHLDLSFPLNLGRLKWKWVWTFSSVLRSPSPSVSFWNSEAEMKLPCSP